MMEPRFRNPFPGLRPFETDEYRLFFGREGQSDELLARLQRSHFLAVVGTSGSGKSSLIRAGLLPALRGGLMAGAGSGWRIAVMRPGGDPIGNLAWEFAKEDVLMQAGAGLPPAEAEAVIDATLRTGSLGVVDVARQARLKEHEKLLIVVDQFEELFRFRSAVHEKTGTGDEASAFVKLLLAASQQRQISIYVVLTMRSDFLGDCSQFQGLPEAINDGQYLIPRMTRDERRFAVTGPVGVTRGKITEPLVNRLLNDVGDNPDQLPILQHALMRTWDHWASHRRNGEPIGVEHYEAVGTMSDALSMHADEAWAELDERGKVVAELLFKALTERGADNREIRRPASLQDICAITNATAAEVIAVIDVFRGSGRSFLMPPAGVALKPETVVDISHESLIRNWDRLRALVEDEAQSARIYRRLADAAKDYYQKAGGLLDDVTLRYVLSWTERSKPTLAWGVRYNPDFNDAMAYLELSSLSADARIEAEQERERRELEMAREFAEKQARAARRLRWLSVALGFIMLVAFGTAVYAFNARADALRSRKAAEESAHTAVVERGQALVAAEAAVRAENIAVGKTEEAKKSEKAALEAKEHAATEETRAEKEAARANQKAREANLQKKAAEENAQQVLGALERGELIRVGLESSRREDVGKAKEAFLQLHDELKPFQPGAPSPPGSRNFTPEQSRQFVNDYGWTLSHLGDTYHRGRDFEKAIEAYEKARVILESIRKNEPAPILFETYHGLAQAYHDSAVQRSAPSRMIRDAGWPIVTQEQFKKAEEFYKKALEYQKPLATANPLVAVTGYKKLAQLYIDIGNFEEAEVNLKHVVEANRTVETRPAEGTIGALKELAEFYQGQGRYQDAGQTYNDLIDIQEGLASGQGLRELADNYSELGQVYNALQDERADNTFQLSDKIHQLTLKIKHKGTKKVGDTTTWDHDVDLDDIGDIYLKLGRFEEAKRSYEGALYIRETVELKKGSLAASYQRLANLYRDHYDDNVKAENYYKLLIEARKDAGDAGSNSFSEALRQYVYGLRQLGALYSGKMNKEAEALFNRALAVLGPVHSRLSWEDIEAVYSELLDLYRGQQNKQGELAQTYAHKLEAMTKLHEEFNNVYYRTEDYAPFMAAYYKTVGETAAFYLETKDTARAENVLRLALSETRPSFIERLHDPKRLDDMASALEKVQALLRDQKKLDEAPKLEVLIKAARTWQKELEPRQRETQEQTPQAPPKP